MENKEFFAALTDLVREKGISQDAFIETLENALASAYKKQYDGGAEITVSLDAEKGTIEFKATRYVVEESGDFRRGEEGVFSGNRCIFMAPPARFVHQLMNDLFDWMKESQTSIHPLILSSVFHYEFVFIHPFSDGNGRMARLWHTAILSKWKPIFEFIPIESQIEKFQDEYYDAIAKCHTDGASTIFITFMLSQIDRILDDISLQFSDDHNQLPEYIRNLLDVMEYDVPYTSNALMEKLGLKSKEGFRRNYLKPATDMNLIRMTIPNKPNSRNQRYVKV